MMPLAARLKRVIHLPLSLLLTLGLGGASLAAPPADPGRLFYTPGQRAQLEAARARNVTQVKQAAPETSPPPLRFDGMVIRSDGKGTSWVNGQPQAGAPGVAGLKPGQIRAEGKVYEPYQVLRPIADPALGKDAAP